MNLHKKFKKVLQFRKEESESGGEMSTIAERLEREYKNERKEGIELGISKGIARGLAQGIRNTIEKLIAKNMNDEFITDVTGYSKQQIAKIRKELENKQTQKSSTEA